MPRLLYAIIIATVLAGTALLTGWSMSASAATGPGKVPLTSREVSRMRVDAGRPGRGIGDMQIIRYNLFNKRLSRRVFGHADYVCTFITSGTRSCTTTFFLPRGRIVAGGVIRYPTLYELAIFGGTRLYDNARGTLTVIRTTRRPRRDRMTFRLTG